MTSTDMPLNIDPPWSTERSKPILLSFGATGIIYQVSPTIVVKCPKRSSREYFLHEMKIYATLAQSSLCAEIATSFWQSEHGFFLEHMPGGTLAERLQENHTRDERFRRVVSVNKIEPLLLRKTWMKALANGCAWLESIGLAHGDLRPENILLDTHDRLKITDFDCADTIGSIFEACIAPWGRILGREGGPNAGSAGYLGARTEQFALGSLFYYINYGMQPYGDQDPGPRQVDLLQDMVFPLLDKNCPLDMITNDCWHNRFASVSLLSDAISARCEFTDYSANPMSKDDFEAKQKECAKMVEDRIFASTAVRTKELSQLLGEEPQS